MKHLLILSCFCVIRFVSGETENNRCDLPVYGKWAKMHLHTMSITMAVYRENDIVSNNIIRYGQWESSLSRFISHPGGLFVDIGTNIGVHSLWAASQGMKVMAIEPMPNNIALLKATLCKNPNLSKNIQIYPYALSSKNGTCHLYSAQRNHGDCHLICTEKENAIFKRKGYVYRGDVIVKRAIDILPVNDITSMKIDVEGHECQVLSTIPRIPNKFVAETTNTDSFSCIVDMSNKQECTYRKTSSDTYVKCRV